MTDEPHTDPTATTAGRERKAVKVTRRSLLEHWWVLPVAGTAGVFGYMGWYASRVTFNKHAAGQANFQPGPPVKIAALASLAQDWAEVEFAYDGRPCTLLRTPRAVTGGLSLAGGVELVAFSRQCTHLGCPVNLVRDQEVLAFAFNYRPGPQDRHPQLGCRCHYSVFDPLKAGEAVFGKAKSPLPRVRLERRGQDIWATGIEAAPPPSN